MILFFGNGFVVGDDFVIGDGFGSDFLVSFLVR